MYVFDVFRVSGGSIHTYCFHAQVGDPGKLPPEVNLPERKPVDGDESPEGKAAADYLADFSGNRYHGTAPENLKAAFFLPKTRPDAKRPNFGSENNLMRQAAELEGPLKTTILHMPGISGAQVMKGDLYCHQWDYHIPNLFVQKKGETLQTVFAAIIEPCVGAPFIAGVEKLQIEGAGTDALAPVALEIKTTNGHTDLCFSDGRPDAVRSVGDRKIAAEFAYLSHDPEGLRQASLTGGTLLETPDVKMEIPHGALSGTVTRVDYWNKKVWIDTAWPETKIPRLVELATQPETDAKAWKTGFETEEILRDGDGTAIRFLRSADLYRAQIEEIDGTRVRGAMEKPIPAAGFERGWTASDENAERTWRVVGTQNGFELDRPVQKTDFSPDNVLRLWEYGVGDRFTLKTWASVRRVRKGVWQVQADTDFALTLRGGRMTLSADGEGVVESSPLKNETEGTTVKAVLPASSVFFGKPFFILVH
jgi:hypothetical protein